MGVDGILTTTKALRFADVLTDNERGKPNGLTGLIDLPKFFVTRFCARLFLSRLIINDSLIITIIVIIIIIIIIIMGKAKNAFGRIIIIME